MRRILYLIVTVGLIISTFVVNVYPAQAATTNLTVTGNGGSTGTYVGGAGDYTNMNSNDGDVSYCRFVSDYLSWTFSACPSSTVNSVNLYATVSATQYGSCGYSLRFYPYVTIGGVVYYGTSILYIYGGVYAGLSYTWPTNPATGLAWTKSSVDSAQFGVYWSIYNASGCGYDSYWYNLRVSYTVLTVDYVVMSPSMTTSPASPVGVTTATLNGAITSTNGADADFRGFVYDTSSHTPLASTNVTPPNGYASNWTESGTFGVAAFTRGLTGLTSGQTYYYRAYAHNTYGWNYGDESTFSTVGVPTVATNPATYISPTTAQLNASVTNYNGQLCDVRFAYGTTSQPASAAGFAAYTNRTAWVNDTYTTGNLPYAPIGSLVAGNTYYFNVQIANDAGISYGVERSFTTSTGLNPPTNFIAIPAASSITLAWSKVSGSPLTDVRYSTSTFPNTTADGTLLYLGVLSSVTHTGLTSGTNYYYSAWGASDGTFSTSKATILGTTLAGTSIIPIAPPTVVTSMWVAMPSELGLANMPMYGFGNWIADVYSMPRATFWLILYIGLIIAVGSALYMKAQSNNLMYTGFGVAIMMIVGTLIGMPTNCLIPIWATVAYLIFFITFALVVNRY